MQNIEHNIEQINSDNYSRIQPIYEDFREKAIKDYKYQDKPIDFNNFILAIEKNLLGGLILFEQDEPEGILIYSLTSQNVLEINAVHSIHRHDLLKGLIKLCNQKLKCDLISYAMLGVQEECVKDIAHSGFRFVGQSIVKFDFQDPVTYRVLKSSGDIDIQDCKLSVWDEKYKEQSVELINLAFKNGKTAYFDPRFLCKEGSEDILNMILTNQYGAFLPYQSRVLLRGDVVEGFCFAVLAAEDKINIPLVAIRKDNRNKGMGKLLLKSVIGGFLKLISEKKFHLKEINATVDTDNYPAIKMYRRLGFREDYFLSACLFAAKLDINIEKAIDVEVFLI